MTSPSLPLVSVLMPVRNEGTFLLRSLGSVLAQDYPHAKMEVLVADGMSEDGTRAEVARLAAASDVPVRWLENPGRIVATGLNRALRTARGEILVRVDGHCEIASDYVRRCVSHLRSGEGDGVGGPLETIGQTPLARAIAVAMSSRFGVGGSAFRTVADRTMFVDTVAFPAYTRAVVDRAGDFDEELVRNQDDEYNFRLREMGFRILLAADVHARYYSRTSWRSLARQYFQYGYWKVRVMQKHPRQMSPRQFAPPVFVTALAAATVAGAAGLSWRWLLGIGALYGAGSAAAAVSGARRGGWWMLPILPAAFATLHLAYGSGFLAGLAKFWNRWPGRPRRPLSHRPLDPSEVPLSGGGRSTSHE
jgi:succinoglycan biosynthesis protein ExoA